MRTISPLLLATAALAAGCAPPPPPKAPVEAPPPPRPWPTFSRAPEPPEQRPSASRVIAEMGRDFKRCQRRALHDHPEANGSVRLAAKVSPSGAVAEVRRDGATALPDRLVSCLTEVVRSRWFAPPGATPVTIVIPIKLLAP